MLWRLLSFSKERLRDKRETLLLHVLILTYTTPLESSICKKRVSSLSKRCLKRFNSDLNKKETLIFLRWQIKTLICSSQHTILTEILVSVSQSSHWPSFPWMFSLPRCLKHVMPTQKGTNFQRKQWPSIETCGWPTSKLKDRLIWSERGSNKTRALPSKHWNSSSQVSKDTTVLKRSDRHFADSNLQRRKSNHWWWGSRADASTMSSFLRASLLPVEREHNFNSV